MIPDALSLIVLTPGFPENEDDSSCLPWMQHFILKLHKQHPLVRITIITLEYPFKTVTYSWNGINVIACGGRNNNILGKSLLRRKTKRLLEALAKENPSATLLSFWYGECARSAEIFARKKNLQHYCWIAGQDAKAGNPYPAAVKIDSQKLIAVSDFIQDHFEHNHGVRPAHVIPFGTDASFFAGNVQTKDIDLLGAGSLIPLKQYEIFIEAVRVIKEKVPGLKAVLIGKGPEEKRLKALIEHYGLADTVTLTGELQYPEVIRYMQQSKILLHPSAYEGFGCVCTEALQAGAAVIRFTKPMKKEMTNTFLVKTKEEMISKAVEILKEKKTFNPVEEYPVEETVRQIIKLC